jgi:uncharacterized damage-inducible protein DinB
MPAGLVEQYRRWFEYEKASHAKVVAALRAIPEEKRATEAFGQAVDLLVHLVGARRLWLERLGGTPRAAEDLFPRGVPLEDAARGLAEMESAWTRYLGRLDDAEAERTFDYQSLEGDWYRNTIADILTQVFGHSWYHRGQIAWLVRSLGCEPAQTDFVLWARERITGPGV